MIQKVGSSAFYQQHKKKKHKKEEDDEDNEVAKAPASSIIPSTGVSISHNHPFDPRTIEFLDPNAS